MSRRRLSLPSVVACLVVTGVAVCGPSHAQVSAPAAITGDEAAIREVVQKFVGAREARDPEAIRSLFTADADQLVSDGAWRKGRDELVRGMIESSQRSGGSRSIRVESVRFLATDIALVDGRYKQAGLADGKDRDLWTTLVLRREPNGWRIAAIRNMLPASPAPAPKR